MSVATMLRLLYLLLRQRLRERRPPPLAYPLLLASLGMLAIALALSLAGRATPEPEAAATATATLKVRIDAVESAPVLVFLDAPGAPRPAASASAARITSVNAAFEPAFQVAALGGEIEIGNRDPIPHNTHLFGGNGRTLFNVATPDAASRVRKPITRAGIFEVRCDLHSWMRASVFVPPGAHHAVLWSAGEVTLAGIAPGRYRLHVWQPARGDAARTLVLAAGDTVSLVH
jgi:plastocyanin